MRTVLSFDHPRLEHGILKQCHGRKNLIKCESYLSEQTSGKAIIHGKAEGKEVDAQDAVSVLYPDENQKLYSENHLPRGTSKNTRATKTPYATPLYLYYKQEVLCDLAYL
jgi:hypothetical protein